MNNRSWLTKTPQRKLNSKSYYQFLNDFKKSNIIPKHDEHPLHLAIYDGEHSWVIERHDYSTLCKEYCRAPGAHKITAADADIHEPEEWYPCMRLNSRHTVPRTSSYALHAQPKRSGVNLSITIDYNEHLACDASKNRPKRLKRWSGQPQEEHTISVLTKPRGGVWVQTVSSNN